MDKERHNQLYAAFKSKDGRFDGRFFVGITSTGIYCRPVCRARMPKEDNCVFYSTAAEAEKAGFRPCLICRPELAPGMSAADAQTALAGRAVRYLGENCTSGESLEALAANLGYTGRHLRRVFLEEYHVSPVEYIQTCRLLLAKALLTDTNLPVTRVAMAAGFGSLRRFNDLFQKKYRLSPTCFRRQAGTKEAKNGAVTVALGYRPPYEWERLLRFLAMRAIPGVEAVSAGEYRRIVRAADKNGNALFGWIRVGNCPAKNLLTVAMSESLLPALPRLLGRVRDLFDLYCDPDVVSESLTAMNDVKPGVFIRGLRVPGCMDPFELCVRAVLGQQITVKAAGTLAGKIAAAFGTPVDAGADMPRYAFPAPADILALDAPVEEAFGALGVIASRSRAIYALAQRFAAREIDWELCAEPEAEMKKLTQIKGIGPWTATYIAMRAMKWTDALPETDLGIRKALEGRTPREILALSEAWKPWRSYATMALWDYPLPKSS